MAKQPAKGSSKRRGKVEKGGGQATSAQDARAGLVARRLVRRAFKGSLGTLARSGGHPYTSLVAVATSADGAPLLLLSGLAEHTRNLAEDPRGSLLVDGTGPGPGALTQARVTLVGILRKVEELGSDAAASARARYLSRHPDAQAFIDFGDFALYRLEPEWAHLVAGASALIGAEAQILVHMNEDHGEAIRLMATRLGGGSGQDWRMSGCDAEGVDLISGAEPVRLEFSHCVTTPDEVRRSLIDMVDSARGL
jgi:putative heme iron utilization protein